MIPFGEKIRSLRNSRTWSQVLLAQHLGVSPSLVAHYELGERFPSLDVLIRSSQVFGVSTDFLLGLGSDKNVINVDGLSAEEIQMIVMFIETLRNKSKNC